jgi:hypothetical protein
MTTAHTIEGMTRLPLVEPATAGDGVRETLGDLATRGPVGPMVRGMANRSTARSAA